MDRDTAKLYCTSFIAWIGGSIINYRTDKKSKLMSQFLEFDKAFKSLVESYEEEIEELKNDSKV